MPDVREVWQSRAWGTLGAPVYDFVLDHPEVARPAGQVLWGCDTRRMYAAMDIVNQLPQGAALLDLPVGGGVTLRRLEPGRQIRYVAADISEDQLDAARRAAERAGLSGIEYVRADVVDLPFADGEFDVVVSFAGLHCMPDPSAAIASLARVLAPGGRLIGSCVARGVNRRFDLHIRAMRAMGVFGPSGTVEDLSRWFADAGLRVVELACNGALAQFTVVKD
ncbi:class I SAM-dependent methyltransferase [Nocardia sp. NBC_00565]|uniref:class I SAM-dependent methyltransferase n=1 Tax=Nocardia sp. NBC_00565 TaxID=2975993 RepID=UPI002E8179BC|nr:class I SAM-dependent methyltransferase [Nocardia sp. NBC_00565]WUC07408.1 class I SAM-dependent methyltransferase [Nocardia sp. NBC_00565]